MRVLSFGTRNMLLSRVFLILVRGPFIGLSRLNNVLVVICTLLVMGNCIGSNSSTLDKALPIDTIFKLPSPLPTWPQGGGFASGAIDLGGLQVKQVTSFAKVWSTYQGGPDNLGATFFEPSTIPDGFSMVGSYAQPNNQPLFGWVLVGKTDASDQSGDILKEPTDYTLVWATGNSSKDPAYFWLPTPPDGYRALGHVVTTSPDKPTRDKIRCVRSDFTDESEPDAWVWALGTSESADGPNVYNLRPKTRGTEAQPLSVGTFIIQDFTSDNKSNSNLPLSCLKKKNSTLSATPNLSQIEALFRTYAPYIYFHGEEIYLPSSVNWFFANGALLYTKGDESDPIPIEPNGSNLPQGGSNDGSYWLDLPINKQDNERVKKGDLESAEVYLHAKPMLGGTFTDIQVWLFYPFNGHATAKLGIIKEIPLGRIGEHVGDWEHVTLRISNFDGVLYRVYFAEHSAGTWVDSSLLEFGNGSGNKFAVYSSLNGHASYYTPGLVMQGTDDVGIRNDTEKSDVVMDTGSRFTVVATTTEDVVAPPWLNYAREWGPTKTYELSDELERIEKFLAGNLKSAFQRLVDALPDEVLGQQGPTGPNMKSNWNGDEE